MKLYIKQLVLLLAVASAALAFQGNGGAEAARWQQQAGNVTIVRDDWGIAHVYGKTDADAVFGMVYAQAEDDFNRVETNYLNAMGRLAEAEGESKIYQDLRMKLFIDPAALKKQYAASPAWLKKLMNAFADGLNYYLCQAPRGEAARHPALRAMDGADASRKAASAAISRRSTSTNSQAFYGKDGGRQALNREPEAHRRSLADRTAWPSRPRTRRAITPCC